MQHNFFHYNENQTSTDAWSRSLFAAVFFGSSPEEKNACIMVSYIVSYMFITIAAFCSVFAFSKLFRTLESLHANAEQHMPWVSSRKTSSIFDKLGLNPFLVSRVWTGIGYRSDTAVLSLNFLDGVLFLAGTCGVVLACISFFHLTCGSFFNFICSESMTYQQGCV